VDGEKGGRLWLDFGLFNHSISCHVERGVVCGTLSLEISLAFPGEDASQLEVLWVTRSRGGHWDLMHRAPHWAPASDEVKN